MGTGARGGRRPARVSLRCRTRQAMVLREEAPSRLFGVSVFRPDGRYSFTIHLTPSVDVRHIVVDGTGELFVVGIDLSSLYRPAGGGLLLHKYLRRWTRLTSFSHCPAP